MIDDMLFVTWQGDDSTLFADLAAVLEKHGVEEPGTVAAFLESTHHAVVDAAGSTSEFTTSMFMLHRSTFPKRLS